MGAQGSAAKLPGNTVLKVGYNGGGIDFVRYSDEAVAMMADRIVVLRSPSLRTNASWQH